MLRPLVIAHRTCPRDAPENSVAGIAAAAEAGADAVEFDVRLASDGQPVLLHDKWLLRTTLWPLRLSWLNGDRVQRIRLRGGGTVPTLAEALQALGPTLRAAIDVKDAAAADAVIDEVQNQGLEERVLFWSQHETAITTAVSRAPELEPTLLRDTDTPAELDQFQADAIRLGAQGISAEWSQVTTSLSDWCRRNGIRLHAWSKSEQIEAEKLKLLDGLVTDWPAAGKAEVLRLSKSAE